MAYFSPRDAAAHLGLSESTLERKRTDGTGPNFVRLSARRVGYRLADIEAWATSNTFAHRAAEYAARRVA